MRRKKPESWDGVSRTCTSTYQIRKGECLGDIDFGQGVIYSLKGKESQRYCSYCHARMYREEDEKHEAKAEAKEQTEIAPPIVTTEINKD